MNLCIKKQLTVPWKYRLQTDINIFYYIARILLSIDGVNFISILLIPEEKFIPKKYPTYMKCAVLNPKVDTIDNIKSYMICSDEDGPINRPDIIEAFKKATNDVNYNISSNDANKSWILLPE